jgi:6-phosphogluconolactonase
MLKTPIHPFDERREIAIPGDSKKTILFAVEHWIQTALEAISKRSRFSVALSGGSTPNAIYEALSQPPYKSRLDWSKVLFFWSDERCVPADHPDSNYHNAMKSGLSLLPLSPNQIFRMKGEGSHEEMAKEYERTLRQVLDHHVFDLVMLGLGEDGHTASLFPHTAALDVKDHLVVANFVPQKKSWRMTLTFPCIEQSRKTVLYALGASKQKIVQDVLEAALPSSYPASRIGTPQKSALWILDEAAAALLCKE